MRFRDRPTGEIMVLSITFTVCFGVLASGLIIAVISILDPTRDVTIWITRVTGILNTMVGLLAGFLAGRTDKQILKSDEGDKTTE
jgi:protein-S-isoprenylcysteine O-methyltransferase Ste14